jgi:beta-galactosidase
MPMVSTESHSTTTTRGVYFSDTIAGFVTSMKDQTEYCWRLVAERPFVAGTFVWTGFDYRGEPTPYGWPCISSHFGFLDTLGFPKDDAFYYKAWWGGEPSVHVFPHWNPEGKPKGKPVTVRCYGNTERVELFVNGKSAGAKPMPKYGHIDWDVPYAPGAISVKGFNGAAEAATETVETTGKAAAIRLVPDRETLKADGEDVAVVRVEIVDDQGRVVPTADNEVKFSTSDGGVIIGVGNGNPSSHEPDRAAKRRAFNGLCGVLVQTSTAPGAITLKASARGLIPALTTLTATVATIRPNLP